MYDKNFIDQIIKLLENEETRLLNELEILGHEDKHRVGGFDVEYPELGDDNDNNAQEVAAFEDRLTIQNTLEKELRDVRNSLKKIKDDPENYGVCKYCHEPINKERLLVRPTSSSCIACKKKLKGEE